MLNETLYLVLGDVLKRSFEMWKNVPTVQVLFLIWQAAVLQCIAKSEQGPSLMFSLHISCFKSGD